MNQHRAETQHTSPRHTSQAYRPPSRDFQDLNSTKYTAYKPRHMSLQSRVESLTADDDWEGRPGRESSQDVPATYNRNSVRSTSFLMDQSTMQNSNPEWMSDRPMAEAPRNPTPPPDHGLNISTLHEILFVGVVVVAQLMALAGLGQAIAPMKIIAAGLDVESPGEEAWFAASFSLTVGTFILISGRMGDILGHKRMLIFGYFFLGVWSGFAGFSAYVEDHIFFDICRGFQGVGAALIVPNALALLGRAYPPGIKKNIVFSLFGAMAPWGFVIGALFASIFAQLTWWPWAFWSYGFACWGLSIFAVIAVPKSLAHDAQFAGRTDRPGMDWTGSVLGVSGLVLGQRRMEQRALIRLGHATRLLPPHHRRPMPHRFRLGRSPRGITSNPSLRLDQARCLHDGSRRHRMGILRNLDPLLLALPAGSPRPDASPHLRRVRACDDLRSARRRSDGLHAHAYAGIVYHHGIHAGLLHRRDRRGLPTRAPNLLGTDVCVHSDHA